jgi:hypothetical protein
VSNDTYARKRLRYTLPDSMVKFYEKPFIVTNDVRIKRMFEKYLLQEDWEFISEYADFNKPIPVQCYRLMTYLIQDIKKRNIIFSLLEQLE